MPRTVEPHVEEVGVAVAAQGEDIQAIRPPGRDARRTRDTRPRRADVGPPMPARAVVVGLHEVVGGGVTGEDVDPARAPTDSRRSRTHLAGDRERLPVPGAAVVVDVPQVGTVVPAALHEHVESPRSPRGHSRCPRDAVSEVLPVVPGTVIPGVEESVGTAPGEEVHSPRTPAHGRGPGGYLLAQCRQGIQRPGTTVPLVVDVVAAGVAALGEHVQPTGTPRGGHVAGPGSGIGGRGAGARRRTTTSVRHVQEAVGPARGRGQSVRRVVAPRRLVVAVEWVS